MNPHLLLTGRGTAKPVSNTGNADPILNALNEVRDEAHALEQKLADVRARRNALILQAVYRGDLSERCIGSAAGVSGVHVHHLKQKERAARG